mmetsp:Transcript_6596/g.17107  ORF Transcript_6596/g.17107 Transcript_6596/m.17107 type:complete len:85 (-) Transcript_6596:81-335(-)
MSGLIAALQMASGTVAWECGCAPSGTDLIKIRFLEVASAASSCLYAWPHSSTVPASRRQMKIGNAKVVSSLFTVRSKLLGVGVG